MIRTTTVGELGDVADLIGLLEYAYYAEFKCKIHSNSHLLAVAILYLSS